MKATPHVYVSDRVSRRDFLKLSSLVAGMGGVMVLSGCGPAAQEPTTDDADDAADDAADDSAGVAALLVRAAAAVGPSAVTGPCAIAAVRRAREGNGLVLQTTWNRDSDK